MSKVLSIIIPTYNMAALLPRCVESLAAAGVNELIEAVIVNDGSKDDSLAVAREYESRYPELVTVIDKPNGNYGSTVNAALPLAKGKYVKILDSDDWFDSDALAGFVNELKDTDVDVAVTHFNILHEDGSKELAKYNVYGKEPFEYGKVYDLDAVLQSKAIRFFLMHSLTYRTEMLLKSSYRQSEGISYTDTQWCAYPIFYAKDVVFYDISLYQYNLAREGQTMDPKVIARSLDQMCRMTYDMFDFYTSFDKGNLSQVRLAFLKQYFHNRARVLAKTFLYDIPRDKFDPAVFNEVDAIIKKFIAENGLPPIRLFPENKIIHVDFYRYWDSHRKRMPRSFETFNGIIDKTANSLYKKLFR